MQFKNRQHSAGPKPRTAGTFTCHILASDVTDLPTQHLATMSDHMSSSFLTNDDREAFWFYPQECFCTVHSPPSLEIVCLGSAYEDSKGKMPDWRPPCALASWDTAHLSPAANGASGEPCQAMWALPRSVPTNPSLRTKSGRQEGKVTHALSHASCTGSHGCCVV